MVRKLNKSYENQDNQKFVLLGTKIPVKTSKDDKLLIEAFDRVKEKISTIDEQASQASKMQVALLAAMNLAGELIEQEKKDVPAEISPRIRQRVKDITLKLKQLEV